MNFLISEMSFGERKRFNIQRTTSKGTKVKFEFLKEHNFRPSPNESRLHWYLEYFSCLNVNRVRFASGEHQCARFARVSRDIFVMAFRNPYPTVGSKDLPHPSRRTCKSSAKVSWAREQRHRSFKLYAITNGPLGSSAIGSHVPGVHFVAFNRESLLSSRGISWKHDAI